MLSWWLPGPVSVTTLIIMMTKLPCDKFKSLLLINAKLAGYLFTKLYTKSFELCNSGKIGVNLSSLSMKAA